MFGRRFIRGVCFFLSYRKGIYKNYSGLFTNTGDGNGDENPEDAEEQDAEAKSEEMEQRKWAWYSFLYSTAKGDIRAIKEIADYNFIFTLTHKSFEVENKQIHKYYAKS